MVGSNGTKNLWEGMTFLKNTFSYSFDISKHVIFRIQNKDGNKGNSNPLKQISAIPTLNGKEE